MSSINIFQEAIDHCRWKTVLRGVLENIRMSDYENKSFEEIIVSIHEICSKVNGLGMLTVYDITSAICRNYGIIIDRVYIVGNGPKRAIDILNISPSRHQITKNIVLKYVSIPSIVEALRNIMDEKIISDGDAIETFLCNWQKTITNDI